jgi:hypothetical protein
MSKLFLISEEEKNRILNLHELATKKQYLQEQSVSGAPNFGSLFLPSGVKAVQKALIFNGYKVKDDGVFGPETKRAVINFQKSKSLTPDGIVGPITANALGVQPLTSTTNKKLPTTATNKPKVNTNSKVTPPKVNTNSKVTPPKEDSWFDKTKNFCLSPVKRMEKLKDFIDSKTVSLNPLPPHMRAFLGFIVGRTNPINASFFKPEELKLISNKVNSYFPSNSKCKRDKKCYVSFYEDTDWSKVKKGEEKVLFVGGPKSIGLTIGNGQVIDNGNSYTVKDIYDFNNYENNPEAYSIENVGGTIKDALIKLACGNSIQGLEELASIKQASGYKGIPVEIEIPKTKTV